MIVPMYKYTFLVFHSAYQKFLKDIRKIGVVHISTKKSEPTLEMQEIFRKLSDVDKTIRELNPPEQVDESQKPSLIDGEQVFKRIKDIEKENENINHLLTQLQKEKKQLIPWGNFQWEKVNQLEKNKLFLRFLACPIKKFNKKWEENYYLQVVNDFEGYRYFVKIESKNETDFSDHGYEQLAGADELILPKKSLNSIGEEIDRLKNEADKLKKEIDSIAFYCMSLLEEYYNDLQKLLAGKNALLQTSEEVDGKVKLLEGWVPETKKSELDLYLEKEKILYIVEKPKEKDKVPILLKNNRFARLYEGIGKLYELPNHKELDLVPFFAPFYMMFFGFSLGDAGYGLFIIALAQLFKKKKPALKSVMSLAQWLGVGTVIFGALTGTFFGIDLLNADIKWLEDIKKYMISTDQLFNLSIIFGVIQILFGMVLKVVNITRVQGFWYSLSTIGWLFLIVGLGSIYGLKNGGVISSEVAQIIQIPVLIIAGVLVLLLNNPKRNIFMNFGAGLWDVYSMTTGLLGDILSYIRLFALGVSSAILGSVFNNMAMNMKPDNIILGPLVMIIILVIGHGITIFMSGLGAFVHPIRLTFVEFYKNAGFTGGGKAYKPFAEPPSKTTK